MRKVRITAVIGLATLALVMSAASGFAVNPPGNNGTVKVDGEDIDGQPNRNEPHVGCDFSIEWYGFDAGAESHVTFETQPPTGSRLLLQDHVQLDGDDNTGGGSPEGLDGVAYYYLDFDNQDYLHPQQGYHVYLTVNTTGSQGADVKHKVFWVTDCYPGG